MTRKIELLLQVASDFQDFCASTAGFTVNSSSNEELTEHDLDMIAAAVKSPSANTGMPFPDRK